ncbi:MAG: CRISPR-associated endonuclease Cas4g/Cas1g, partial [Longimicrobiales bacterium]
PLQESPDLLPVRMLNEYAYCPRLFHLMHVEGQWADNVYTVEGQEVHRRVDRIEQLLPDPTPSTQAAPAADGDGDDPPAISRSVKLSSPRLGLVAKLDLVSTAGDEAVPVDTKRGRVPRNPERSWEPERVQLMAQGMLLRDHGYRCDHGVIYFAESRTRVDVPFTAELEARALQYLAEARRAAHATVLPDPLEDSPKCNGCSLNGICLPDETLALRDVPADPVTAPTGVRRLYPPRDEALALYVQEQGATVGKDGDRLAIRKDGEILARARMKDIDQLVVCGGVMVTSAAFHALCEAGIPIVHLSRGNWFYGITAGFGLRNAFDRAAQFEAASNPTRVLTFARAIVRAKCMNQRTLLIRNAKPRPAHSPRQMTALLRKVPHARDTDELLGLEGALGAIYFRHFESLLRPRDMDASWDFASRNRRPPRDPVNAMLSFGYALLAKECTVALAAAGLDPWWGLFHRPRHGRAGLALDLMEEFRPLIVDSAVITAINTGMVAHNDFTRTAQACMLNASGRKAFIRAYEARLDQLVTHPLFGYRCTWRTIIRVQARLLGRWLRGDVPSYIGMTTR